MEASGVCAGLSIRLMKSILLRFFIVLILSDSLFANSAKSEFSLNDKIKQIEISREWGFKLNTLLAQEISFDYYINSGISISYQIGNRFIQRSSSLINKEMGQSIIGSYYWPVYHNWQIFLQAGWKSTVQELRSSLSYSMGAKSYSANSSIDGFFSGLGIRYNFSPFKKITYFWETLFNWESSSTNVALIVDEEGLIYPTKAHLEFQKNYIFQPRMNIGIIF